MSLARLPKLAGPSALTALLISMVACNSGRNQLLADIQSPRPEERALAVRKLAQQNHADDLVLFTHAAKDVSFLVRQEAATALGKSQDLRVVDLLGDLLEDPDEEVQAKAALALADIKSDKAKAYLTLQYSRRGPSTRRAIVQALRNAGVGSAMASVVNAEAHALWQRDLLALNEGSLPERVGAAEDLGQSGRPEAITRLQSLLKDSQVILAAAAVRGLGQAGDPHVAGAVSELLTENFPELRSAALQALRQLRSPDVLHALEGVALEKSSASAEAVLAILALPRSPSVDEALCHLAVDASEGVAVTAGEEMRRRGGCPLDLLEKKLDKTSKGLRRGEKLSADTQAAGLIAVRALGPTAKGAEPWVIPLTGDKELRLRHLAIAALGALEDAAAAPAVEKAFTSEAEAVRPARAKWVATPLPKAYSPGFDPQSAPAEDKTTQRTADLTRRLAALDAERWRQAGKQPPAEGTPPELADDLPEEQLTGLAVAAKALGETRAPAALEKLRPLTQDSSAQLRKAALVGLAYLGAPGVALARLGLLEPDREMRASVASALVDGGPPGVEAVLNALPKVVGDKMPLLESLATHPLPPSASAALQPIVREGGAEAAAAASLLGAMKATDAEDVLLQGLEDRTSVARRAILTALGSLGDPRATDAIQRDLYHDSPDVRAAAAAALAQLGGPVPSEPLEALKGDFYRRVRDAAQAALARSTASPGGTGRK